MSVLAAPAFERLARAKAAAGLRVAACVPARDEEPTVAGVVGPLMGLAGGARPLVDAVIVADDGSVDRTAAVAAGLGADVVASPAPAGKGAAMDRAAGAARAAGADVVVFLDADVTNFGPHFVTRLLAPLIDDHGLVMVKGSYRRALAGAMGEGGRVTELLARPLIERLFPELSHLAQPLAGEVAIRTAVLDRLVLEPGYGVEAGMLVDVARLCGPAAIGEACLGERHHRNRPLAELSDQARQVLAALLDRARPHPPP